MNFRYYKTKNLILFIFAMSLIIGIIIDSLDFIQTNNYPVFLRKIIDYGKAISIPSLLAGLLFLIDKYAWKWKISNFIINVPNLNGRYKGISFSSYTGIDFPIECVIEIKQRASKIYLTAYYFNSTTGNDSTSIPLNVDLINNDNGFFDLYFTYIDYHGPFQSDVGDHPGTAILKFIPTEKILKGEYFNRRKNIGEIDVKFIQSKLLGKF